VRNLCRLAIGFLCAPGLILPMLASVGAVEVPKPAVTVNVPRPTINVPRPTINVPRPNVTVNVPKPAVNVTRPVIASPHLTVATPRIESPKSEIKSTAAKIDLSSRTANKPRDHATAIKPKSDRQDIATGRGGVKEESEVNTSARSTISSKFEPSPAPSTSTKLGKLGDVKTSTSSTNPSKFQAQSAGSPASSGGGETVTLNGSTYPVTSDPNHMANNPSGIHWNIAKDGPVPPGLAQYVYFVGNAPIPAGGNPQAGQGSQAAQGLTAPNILNNGLPPSQMGPNNNNGLPTSAPPPPANPWPTTVTTTTSNSGSAPPAGPPMPPSGQSLPPAGQPPAAQLPPNQGAPPVPQSPAPTQATTQAPPTSAVIPNFNSLSEYAAYANSLPPDQRAMFLTDTGQQQAALLKKSQETMSPPPTGNGSGFEGIGQPTTNVVTQSNNAAPPKNAGPNSEILPINGGINQLSNAVSGVTNGRVQAGKLGH
jgi:hypothetical protein